MIGIVVALPEELRTLTAKKIAKGSCGFIAENILLAHSGAGSENAQRATELLISKGASCLISWGCAAALADNLKPGDLTLPAVLITADNEQMEVDSAWYQHCKTVLSSYLPVHSGALLESKHLVALSRDKKHLHYKTNAIVLDMETVAVAKVARQHHLSFLALRVIADPVSMDLPEAIAYSLNDDGEVVLSRLFLFILKHPNELPKLMELGLHFNAAKKTLKQIATQLDAIIKFSHQA